MNSRLISLALVSVAIAVVVGCSNTTEQQIEALLDEKEVKDKEIRDIKAEIHTKIAEFREKHPKLESEQEARDKYWKTEFGQTESEWRDDFSNKIKELESARMSINGELVELWKRRRNN